MPPPPILLTLYSPSELFSPPPIATRLHHSLTACSFDHIGATLGQPGIARLIHLLEDQPAATQFTVRVVAAPASAPADPASAPPAAAADLLPRLREWCECQILANRAEITRIRRLGLRALAFALFFLAAALGASLLLHSETVLGPAGALRKLLGEALVIAGWVVMWRPCEMLLFDPLRPAHENRLLKRFLAMSWSVESVERA